MRCSLCGHIFDESKKADMCKGCRNCKMVMCPHCGYENLPEIKTESKLINFLKRRIKSEDK
jgi:hypothetical protein